MVHSGGMFGGFESYASLPHLFYNIEISFILNVTVLLILPIPLFYVFGKGVFKGGGDVGRGFHVTPVL